MTDQQLESLRSVVARLQEVLLEIESVEELYNRTPKATESLGLAKRIHDELVATIELHRIQGGPRTPGKHQSEGWRTRTSESDAT